MKATILVGCMFLTALRLGAQGNDISVSVSPSSVTLSRSQTAQFTATVTNSTAGVTWSLKPVVGTISSSGLYTAPATISSSQTVTIMANSVDKPNKFGSAKVNLQAISVSVSPTTAALGPSQTAQFTATVTNSTSGVTWSINPAVGTISSSGLYTAPAAISSSQTVTVIATSVADTTQSGSATVSLQPSSTPTLVTANLVGYWNFKQGSNPQTAPDLSGNGYNAQRGSTPAQDLQDPIFSARGTTLDGYQEYWQAPDETAFEITNSWTLELVFAPNSGNTNKYLVDKHQWSIIFGFVANTAELYGSPGGLRSASGITLNPNGTPHDLVWAYDGSYLATYLDGVQVHNTAVYDAFPVGTTPLRIGNEETVGSQGPDADFVAVAVYNGKKLSATEVANNFQYHNQLLASRAYNINLVFDGDSLTQCLEWLDAGGSNGTRFPDLTISAISVGSHYAMWWNTAVGGRTLVDMQNNAPTAVDPKVNTVAGPNILNGWGGTNDMCGGCLGGNVDGTTAHGRYLTYVTSRQSAGWGKIIVATALPRSDAAAGANFSSRRATFNSLLRTDCGVGTTAAQISSNTYGGITYKCGSSSPFNYLADFAMDSRIGPDGSSTNTTYFMSDQVHLNGTGNKILADIANTAILDATK